MTKTDQTAPASVTPASDEEIADTKSRAVWDSAIGSVRALKLIARIEQEKAQNAAWQKRVEEMSGVEFDLRSDLSTLRARLAEVSEAAVAVVNSYWKGDNLKEIKALDDVLTKKESNQ